MKPKTSYVELIIENAELKRKLKDKEDALKFLTNILERYLPEWESSLKLNMMKEKKD